MTGPSAGVRVVLADDHPIFRDGVAVLLRQAGVEVVAGVGDAVALRDAVRATRPDVAVVDVRMPPGDRAAGLAAAVALRREHPRLGVLVLSQYQESHHLGRLLRGRPRGVGYLLKDKVGGASFVEGVRRVAAGGYVVDRAITRLLLGRAAPRLAALTPRELEVLDLLAQGYSDQAICAALGIGPKTVHTHVSHVFTKLGLPPEPEHHRRVLAVLIYLEERD